jgi:hypothetical protein
MRKFIFLIVVATWQIEMSVECAVKCIRRPTPEVPLFHPAAKSATAPVCKGPQCPPLPTPQPKSVLVPSR